MKIHFLSQIIKFTIWIKLIIISCNSASFNWLKYFKLSYSKQKNFNFKRLTWTMKFVLSLETLLLNFKVKNWKIFLSALKKYSDLESTRLKYTLLKQTLFFGLFLKNFILLTKILKLIKKIYNYFKKVLKTLLSKK